MNDSELDRILKSAKVPERTEDYWTNFPRRVLSRLHWKPAPSAAASPGWMPRLAWSLALITICLIVGFVIGHRRGTENAVVSNGLLQNERVIREMLAMFPNRVRAIVQDERGLNLVLAENDDVPASTPLWVKVCDGRGCSVAITFSGQEIEVGGKSIQVLANGSGGVILVGDDFLWSTGGSSTPAGLRIEARALGT